MKLENRVAIVTGASRGIGKATAIQLAKEGAKIVVNYREKKENGKAVVNEIEESGGSGVLVQADVSNPADVKHLFQEAEKTFGTVDILVNNAGVSRPKPFLELTFEDWRYTLDTNVIGVFLCAQEAARIMVKKKYGKIINMASIRGLPHCGREGIVDYSASKAAVVSLTTTLAKALAPYVNVNAVAPGFTETEMFRALDESVRQSGIKDTYLKRFIQPEEIARAIIYLASDDAKSVTGQVLVVDCGYSLK